ncbi:MAG: peptidyl-prolyl cis-trans isomerase [Verrucomicrobiae bacterium]|nr:peptidyl-prolyl cis-trans isomerase [Verrucomicrobiae bacterium]
MIPQAFRLLPWFAAVVLVAASATAEVVDGVAAVVNEDIITFSDVKDMVGQSEESLAKALVGSPELPEKIREARKAALDQLIERRLIIQQFNARGGKVPDSVIEEDIQSIIDEQYGRDRGVFIRTLEALGMNLETFKERVKEKIIVRYMQNHEVSNEILISPYKIEKYYREHLDAFKEGEKIKLRMLYIKKSDDPEEIAGARSLAQEILLKLSTGSDFASLAAVYSEGSEKSRGGDLGFIGRSELDKELQDAAFSLKPGQISKVIETKDNLYILMVEEKISAKVTSLEEARDTIEGLLVRQERERLQKRWIASLKRKAYIRTY